MSDEGQSYYEMLRNVGKMPHEFRQTPAPSRYFVEQAHREYVDRMNDGFDTTDT